MKPHREQYHGERGQRASALAEFGPVLFILLVIILLPLIGFFSFASGCATIYFAAAHGARAAAGATTLGGATANMKAVGRQIIAGPFGSFANLSPKDDSAISLQVLRVPVTGGAPAVFSTTDAIDTNNNFYEYQVTASYSVKPLFIPGGPFPMQFVCSANVEHPEGLNSP